MNAAPDIVSRLEELVFNHNLQSQHLDDALSVVSYLVRQVTTGFGIGVVLGIGAVLVLIFVYRPRMGRGSLWIPVFGLFGGTPTFYLHTRPASFCGVFSHTRRLRGEKKWSARGAHHTRS
jgi:hypothetical protein